MYSSYSNRAKVTSNKIAESSMKETWEYREKGVEGIREKRGQAGISTTVTAVWIW